MSDLIPVSEMAPDDSVALRVFDRKNAGRSPKSRFGVIAFDDQGYGEVTVKAKDLPLLDAWGWIQKDDKLRLWPEQADAPVEPDGSTPKRNLAAQGAMAEAFNKEREALMATIDELQAKVAEQQGRLDHHEAFIEDRQVRIAELEKQVVETERACVTRDEHSTKLQARVTELEKQLADAMKKSGNGKK